MLPRAEKVLRESRREETFDPNDDGGTRVHTWIGREGHSKQREQSGQGT